MLHADRHRFYTPLMRRSLWGAKAQGESDFVLPPELEHSEKICEQFLNDAAEIMEVFYHPPCQVTFNSLLNIYLEIRRSRNYSFMCDGLIG